MFISCIPSKLIEVGHYQCARDLNGFSLVG